MSKSRREQKYIRLSKRADRLSRQFDADITRVKSRLDPEIHARVTLAMEKHDREVLTPEVLEDMKLGYERLSRVGAEMQAQNIRLISWLRAQQEKEWKERYNRPLPGGMLMRTKRLRKKQEAAIGVML